MSATRERKLNELLESVQLAHRKDIIDFAGGHLNESKLYKSPENFTYKSWGSDPIQKPHKKSKIPRSKNSLTERVMQDTMLEFAAGTTGTMLMKPKKDMRVKANTKSKPPTLYDKVEDNHLVEELPPNEVMLPTPRFYRTKAWNDQDLAPEEISKPVQTQGELRSKNLATKLNLQHQFVQTHVGAITKKDQMKRLKKLQNEVVRKHDSSERHVLQGVKAVEHLEDKLKQRLEALDSGGYGPNFSRLQAYGEVFDDLIHESQTFGHVLRTIQEEYDNYIDCLLDNHPSQHRLLRNQVDELTSQGISNPNNLAKERHRVLGMENEGRKLLELNNNLRDEIKTEQALIVSTPEPEENQKPIRSFQEFMKFHFVSFQNIRDSLDQLEETPLELEEQIEDLRGNILEKMDNISALKKTLNHEYVPASVCMHLEQCVKETEIEIQKLLKQNEVFENDMKEQGVELQNSIDACEATEEDEERIWRKINGNPCDPGYESPGEDWDSANRWGWYIS